MPAQKKSDSVFAKDRNEWRKWLSVNHQKSDSVWLIIYHKKSTTPSIYYDEAVEEALCFGWIDSKPNKRDENSFFLYFSKRKAKSNWSLANKKRVKKLLKDGLIEKAGLEAIDIARKNGSWDALKDVDRLKFPEELSIAFQKNKTAQKYFRAFPPSTQRGILEWISNAKKTETKTKRILETVTLAEKNIRANQYRL